MRRPAAWVAAAALASGCGILQPGMPDWIANRQPLDSCADGVIAVDSPEAAAAERCMLDAFRAGRGAELITSGEMETGDPLTSYVRVHENGTVEMFLKLGDDPLAAGAWERFRCDGLVPNDVVRGAGEASFTLGGCELLPVP